MNKNIEVSTNQSGDISIIRIKGDVTSITGEVIEDAYQKLSPEGAQKILLCFDRECYINSGGIAVLIGMTSESRKKGQKIGITGISDHFRKIFDMVGLTRYTQVFPSEDAAIKEF